MSDYQFPSALAVTTTGGWARPGWWDIIDEARKDRTPSGRFGPADTQIVWTTSGSATVALPNGAQARDVNGATLRPHGSLYVTTSPVMVTS